MNKFSLLAFKSKKNELLEKIQAFSNVQFIDLGEEVYEKEEYDFLIKNSEATTISDLESNISKIKFSLDIIGKYVDTKESIKDKLKGKKTLSYSELKSLEKNIQWDIIYNEIRAREDKVNALLNEVSKLSSDIETLIPWKKVDISLKDLESMKTSIGLLGYIPRNYKESFREELESSVKESYIEEISEVREDLNLLVIIHKECVNKAEEILKKYSFTKANLGYRDSPNEIINRAEKRIDEIKAEKQSMIKSIKLYEKELENLKIAYEYFLNEIGKVKASENFLNTKKVVLIKGWVPEKNKEQLEEVIKNSVNEYYLEFLEPNEEDDVPIMLDNNSLVKPFESITSMYSLPKYNEVDPTPLLVPFYLIFFGMMLSDAGYGLLMLLGTTLSIKFVPLEDDTRAMVKLFFYLSIPTIFWGIMYGSYFTGAINIPPVWMKPEENANFLLFIAIAFGLVQIYIGLAVKAYLLIRNKQYLDAFYDVGLWYITLTTVILYLAGSFGNVTALQGSLNAIKYIMFAGMIGLVLTQGRSNKGIGAKLGAGLYGLYGITGYIGDLVSYSRLMALGLATGFIGGALNLIISFLGTGIKAWIFGPIIFVIGHVFNLLINSLGSYVHTSRLQYVEYFGKFYEGGGKPFTPLKYTNKFIKIKTE
ncbi:V/A-type H+-transporting ATPase subunit I [Clostridium tetanomorphum]|nr:V/A-type H+-transporting ATPase subunit I [Clostridium tetanomorphum]